MAKSKATNKNTTANFGFEVKLCKAVDALRNNTEAFKYKQDILGPIFLKYINNAFDTKHSGLNIKMTGGTDPEGPDEYRALNIFWVPPEVCWSHLKMQSKQPKIGQLAEDAMAGIERDNPSIKAVLSKDYSRPMLDKQRIGQSIDLISNIRVGNAEVSAKDERLDPVCPSPSLTCSRMPSRTSSWGDSGVVGDGHTRGLRCTKSRELVEVHAT